MSEIHILTGVTVGTQTGWRILHQSIFLGDSVRHITQTPGLSGLKPHIREDFYLFEMEPSRARVILGRVGYLVIEKNTIIKPTHILECERQRFCVAREMIGGSIFTRARSVLVVRLLEG